MILDFAGKQADVSQALSAASISVDMRKNGIRISPHIYNSESDMDKLLEVLKPFID